MISFQILIRFTFFIFISTNFFVVYSKDDVYHFQISNKCKHNYINCNKDELEYLAISELHDQIDDDKNGDIDITESKDFVKESLSSKHGTEKAKRFHKTDAHIDKQDLWHIWKTNEVYNWSTSDLIDWLIYDVKLPQYEKAFISLKLNGSSLSRLTGIEYLTNIVKIQNPIHRKKIMIKAVDAVLFGSQKRFQMSNISIMFTLLFFISIIAYLFIQNIYSKRFVKKMQSKLSDLSRTEESLTELQNKLKIVEDIKKQKDSEIQKMEARHRQEITLALNSSRESLYEDPDKSKSQQEIIKLRSALRDAQTQINQLIKKSNYLPLPNETSGDSQLLHLLLQLTHAIEYQYLAEKIAQIDRQSAEFKELNEKVKKKKSAFLGTFRVIHSSDMDDIEKGFAATKRAYEKVLFEKKEQEFRWSQLETITGFSLIKIVDISSVRQMIHNHMESVDHQKKEYSNNSLFISNNEFIDHTFNHSDSVGTSKSEKSTKSSEISVQFSLDSTDHGSGNSIDSSENSNSLPQPTIECNDETILTKRSRRDHTDMKRNLYKFNRTRIPSLNRMSENSK